ncbi:GGDEF domain-containing protein [Peribacillus saganii]|uniref:GGDEF domain-containing protein n=1 Tax=Peribacillus saganii TaxID=2303992 RepID=A0A372LLQ9_9BACI|nr:GGDEF domain-containing protein [Peribacillus saganii]RFU67581.1 GGDEF domain-containing protein [Peribacillus saganii]
MQLTIGDIAEEATIVSPFNKCEDVYAIFNEHASLEGIVVCTDQHAVGLVMKTHFYQKLSTKYGFDLFMKRTVDLVMNKKPLVVEYSLPIAEAGALAMKRNLDHLYDYVIVIKQDRLYGIVSIKNLLIKLAEVQVQVARYSNPLTGLPGNYAIEETLQEILAEENFSVLYVDIDTFKVFNDSYGFKEGDELIRATADIICDIVLTTCNHPSFVGHIGGDDFIAVLPNYNYDRICRSIISRFDQLVRKVYSEDEIKKGYVTAISRKGKLEKFPLVSISIAVITNINMSFVTVKQLSKEAAKVKKRCKTIPKSVFLTMEDCWEEVMPFVTE